MRFLISGLITFVVMAVLSRFIADDNDARSTLIVGIMVGVVIAAMPIYNIEKWTLARRSLVHFLVMLVTIIPCLMLSGWFEWRSSSGALSMFATFAAFGVAGWPIGYGVNWITESRSR